MVFWVAAVGFGRYVLLLAVGLERFERFWSLRGFASGRSELFWTVWVVWGGVLRRGGRFWSLRGLASGTAD